MKINELAYEFLIKNRIIDFKINIELLKDICKLNDWQLGNYSKNIKFFELSNLMEKMYLQSFIYYYKNDIYIFYNSYLEENEIILNILHEIGHIILNHKNCELSNIQQEKEANLFACEVLAPSCLIEYLNLKKWII